MTYFTFELDQPMIWSHAGASIGLYPLRQGKQDRFQKVLIARTAAIIAQKCLSEEYAYKGGALEIGDQQEYSVQVHAMIPGAVPMTLLEGHRETAS